MKSRKFTKVKFIMTHSRAENKSRKILALASQRAQGVREKGQFTLSIKRAHVAAVDGRYFPAA